METKGSGVIASSVTRAAALVLLVAFFRRFLQREAAWLKDKGANGCPQHQSVL